MAAAEGGHWLGPSFLEGTRWGRPRAHEFRYTACRAVRSAPQVQRPRGGRRRFSYSTDLNARSGPTPKLISPALCRLSRIFLVRKSFLN